MSAAAEVKVTRHPSAELTDDMTVADLRDVFEHLPFGPRGGSCMLQLDRGVRDYLLRRCVDADPNSASAPPLPAAVVRRGNRSGPRRSRSAALLRVTFGGLRAASIQCTRFAAPN